MCLCIVLLNVTIPTEYLTKTPLILIILLLQNDKVYLRYQFGAYLNELNK